MRLSKILLVLYLVCNFTLSIAASLDITPVRIFFSDSSTIQAMRLKNQGEDAVLLQLDINTWLQDAAGHDYYHPTNAVIVTPAIFLLPPGETQLVRLAITHPKVPSQEESFRLFIREVKNNTLWNSQALNVALEILVPIFIEALNKDNQPSYTSVIEEISENKTELTIINTGHEHFLVTGLCISEGKNILIEKEDLFSYLLPGSTKRFLVDIPIPKEANITLHAKC